MSTPAIPVHQYLYESEEYSIEWSKDTLNALEPLLARNSRRFVLFPIKYLAIWRAYKHAVSTFWIADTIDASNDVIEWQKTCSSTERRLVSTLLIVLETTNDVHERLFATVSAMTTCPEARCFFGFQGMIENVHREALAKLASTFLPYHGTGAGAPMNVGSMKSLQRKLEWIKNKSEDQSSLFSEKILLLLFIQGLSSASTAAIFKRISEQDVLRCLIYTYNKISVDRETHVNFATLLFYHLERRPTAKYAENLITEMVEVERSFAEELIRNMGSDIAMYSILRDIECVADGLLASVGYKPIYGVLTDQMEVDKKVTGGLKALYFEHEMTTAYTHPTSPPPAGSYDQLSFDLLD